MILLISIILCMHILMLHELIWVNKHLQYLRDYEESKEERRSFT